jgi:hypothetical protein
MGSFLMKNPALKDSNLESSIKSIVEDLINSEFIKLELRKSIDNLALKALKSEGEPVEEEIVAEKPELSDSEKQSLAMRTFAAFLQADLANRNQKKKDESLKSDGDEDEVDDTGVDRLYDEYVDRKLQRMPEESFPSPENPAKPAFPLKKE